MAKIWVLIPAFNEENAVGKVIAAIPLEKVEEIIVVNNNSTDRTSRIASEAGATVLFEEQKGYGKACLKGMGYLSSKKELEANDIVVFIDADYSDYPEQLGAIVQPIESDQADLVIGSRALGQREAGSMTVPQIFGNWLAALLIRILYGKKLTDLGPFRAIRYDKLIALKMQDENYGWTVEMQIKAFKANLRYIEVPVNYRRRIGFSKISGTLKGTVMAGYKIISTIFKYSI